MAGLSPLGVAVFAPLDSAAFAPLDSAAFPSPEAAVLTAKPGMAARTSVSQLSMDLLPNVALCQPSANDGTGDESPASHWQPSKIRTLRKLTNMVGLESKDRPKHNFGICFSTPHPTPLSILVRENPE